MASLAQFSVCAGPSVSTVFLPSDGANLTQRLALIRPAFNLIGREENPASPTIINLAIIFRSPIAPAANSAVSSSKRPLAVKQIP